MKPDQLIERLANGEDPLTIAKGLLQMGLVSPEYRRPDKSFSNCHTPGVDSVTLYHGDNGMVRFYVNWAGISELHNLVDPDTGHFTVGIHNHRYRIAKIPLSDGIVNVRTRPHRVWNGGDTPMDEEPTMILWEYGFRSALKGEGMGVTGGEPRAMTHFQPDVLLRGDVAIMEAHELHTIVTPPPPHDSAWLVIEGSPVNVAPVIYSPQAGLDVSSEGLYAPMSDAMVANSIQYVLRLMGDS